MSLTIDQLQFNNRPEIKKDFSLINQTNYLGAEYFPGFYFLRFLIQIYVEPRTATVKTVPVNFLVNIVVIQYCVYYEIYWNSL